MFDTDFLEGPKSRSNGDSHLRASEELDVRTGQHFSGWDQSLKQLCDRKHFKISNANVTSKNDFLLLHKIVVCFKDVRSYFINIT